MIFNFKDTQDAKALKKLKQVEGTEILNTSILEKAMTLSDGLYVYKLGGGNYNVSDLPHINYAYGQALILVRGALGAYENTTVFLFGAHNATLSQKIAINYRGGSGWTGWNEFATIKDLANELAKYLPLKGGELTGDVTLRSLSAEMRRVIFQNSVGIGWLGIEADGTIRLVNTGAGNKEILKSTADGTTTFNGTASGSLSLNGGIVSGNISQYYSTNAQITRSIGNNTRIIQDVIASGGTYTKYDATNKKWIIESSADGTTIFNGKATGNGNPVHIGTSAPSDTTALWIDTSA